MPQPLNNRFTVLPVEEYMENSNLLNTPLIIEN